MFLLIPFLAPVIESLKQPLNSIMFLLIQEDETPKAFDPDTFKFHYVSINSIWKLLINSWLRALNSIMFLLIQVSRLCLSVSLCRL